jgi:hypothetical protein
MFGLGLRALDIVLMAGGLGRYLVWLDLGWTWFRLSSSSWYRLSINASICLT